MVKFLSVEGTSPSQADIASPKALPILRYATPSDPPAERVRALVESCRRETRRAADTGVEILGRDFGVTEAARNFVAHNQAASAAAKWAIWSS
jgi:hypothetical protein